MSDSGQSPGAVVVGAGLKRGEAFASRREGGLLRRWGGGRVSATPAHDGSGLATVATTCHFLVTRAVRYDAPWWLLQKRTVEEGCGHRVEKATAAGTRKGRSGKVDGHRRARYRQVHGLLPANFPLPSPPPPSFPPSSA